MFLKNKNIIFKIRRSKVTDYAPLSICDVTGNESWSLHYIFAVIVYLNGTPTTILQNYTMTSSVLAFLFKEKFQRCNGVIVINKLHKTIRDVTGHLLVVSLLLSIYLALFKVIVNIQT